MNCYLHPDVAATAFCRTCGRSLCNQCQRPAEGTVFCQDHVPAPAYADIPHPGAAGPNPYFQQEPGTQFNQAQFTQGPGQPVRTSPGLAFLLGLIPGVGAIYNGQYLKGLVHALVTGLLITLTDNTPGSGQALTGMLLAAFFFYMPFEAYHTAKKREAGLVPDEWSSILPQGQRSGKIPVGPVVLIAIGVLYLLNSLNLLDFRQVGRFWPVLLIVAGAYMLYSRVKTPETPPPYREQPYGPGPTPSPDDYMGTRHD